MRPLPRALCTWIRSAVLLSADALPLGCGPLGTLPGGALRGTLPEPGAPLLCTEHTIQLETRPDDPHSVNTWCVSLDDRFYIPTSLILGDENPLDREWVQNVLADDRVRVRVEDVLYERRAVRVTEEGEVEQAKSAFLTKYEFDPDEHSSAAWIFRMEPR